MWCLKLLHSLLGLLHGAGWLALPKRQYQSVAIALNVLSSSRLKYACKIAQCASLGDILASLEATYVNENGEYEKNILLLTSEVSYFYSFHECTRIIFLFICMNFCIAN